MADIDKTLPNVKTSIEVNPQEEIEIEQEKALEAQDPGVEVTPNEDGSVEVNFDPSNSVENHQIIIFLGSIRNDFV